jgi:hypothetical protein
MLYFLNTVLYFNVYKDDDDDDDDDDRCVDDELQVGQLARKAGFDDVSLSHQVMPMVRIVPRGFTACADAYLTPHIKKYLQVSFLSRKWNLRLKTIT